LPADRWRSLGIEAGAALLKIATLQQRETVVALHCDWNKV
jgi:hypothetical protein